jgi:hypothetical protein
MKKAIQVKPAQPNDPGNNYELCNRILIDCEDKQLKIKRLNKESDDCTTIGGIGGTYGTLVIIP